MGRPRKNPIEQSTEDTTLAEPISGINETGALEANSSDNMDRTVTLELENRVLKSQVSELMRGFGELKNSLSGLKQDNADEETPELGKVIHGKGTIPTDHQGNIVIDSNMVPGSSVTVNENGQVIDNQYIVYKLIDGTEKKTSYREFQAMIGRYRLPALAKDYIVWGRGATATSLYHYPNMPIVRDIERTKEMEIFIGKKIGSGKDDVEYDMSKTIKIKKHLWN